jgi:hypothetical protein
MIAPGAFDFDRMFELEFARRTSPRVRRYPRATMLRDLRLAVAAVLVAATIAVVAFVRSAPAHPVGPTPSDSEPAPAAVSATPGRPSVALSVKAYGSDPIPNPPSAPTADVGQAKVWELDDRWWAALVEPSSGAFHIYGLDGEGKHWVDTGVAIDGRAGVHPDAIVSGGRLYVVSSARSRIATARPEVRRFSYTAGGGWTLDRGFPVAAYDVGVSSPSIGRDSSGRVWVSFVDQGHVYVNASGADENDWGPAWRMTGPGTVVRDEDVARLVAYGGNRIGVFWSNQVDETFRFASHPDGAKVADPDAWTTETAASGVGIADNHIDLMTAPIGGAERVMAVVKTSRNVGAQADRNAPLIVVLAQRPEGGWAQSIVGRVRDHQTRPMLLIDPTNRLAVVTTTRGDVGSHIAWQVASLDDLRFSPGGDRPLIGDEDDVIIDATSTHAAVDFRRGVVVVGWDQEHGRYEHAVLTLGA